MNEIFNSYTSFCIVYIDDVLIFSQSIDQHWKHLNTFLHVVRQNGLAIFAKKIKLFQASIQFLGFKIYQGTLTPINRVISFVEKFSDELRDKKQLQRFLGCLNYVSDFYKNLAVDRKLLTDRLKKNLVDWSEQHTQAVRKIKEKVKFLPCLNIIDIDAFKIVETDASNIGYRGILKQKKQGNEQLVSWNLEFGPRKILHY